MSYAEIEDLENKVLEWEQDCWRSHFVQRISRDMGIWNLYMEALTLDYVSQIVWIHWMGFHPNRFGIWGRFEDE